MLPANIRTLLDRPARRKQEGTMKHRRSISALVLVSLLLAACGSEAPKAQATPAPEEAVTVTFWHGQSGGLGKELQKLIDKFNATHQTQIKAEFKGTYPQLYQAVVAAIQAGSPPDMAQVPGSSQTASYLKAKALAPVQKFVDSADGYTSNQLKDFYPAFLDDNRLTVDGKSQLVSWPLSKSMQVLYYNPKILEQAGVAVPTTYKELRDALKTIKQKVQNVSPMSYTADFYYFFLPMLRAGGGDLLNKNLDKVAFNSDAGRAALQYQVDLALTDKTTNLTKGYEWQNSFAAGKVAFAISTSVSQSYIEQAMPANSKFTVGVAPLPAVEKKANNTLFGNNLVIFNKASAAKQRGAWLFMKWMAELDQTVSWSVTSSYLPVRQSALNDAIFKERLASNPSLKIALTALKDSQGVTPSPDLEKITPVMDAAITKALQPTSPVSPAAALSEAERKVNDILKGD
jgi:multiple sugar transport system substrate-binding protein